MWHCGEDRKRPAETKTASMLHGEGEEKREGWQVRAHSKRRVGEYNEL